MRVIQPAICSRYENSTKRKRPLPLKQNQNIRPGVERGPVNIDGLCLIQSLFDCFRVSPKNECLVYQMGIAFIAILIK